MSQDLELEFGKEEIIKKLNELYEEGHKDVRNEILKHIAETDGEVAFYQHELFQRCFQVIVMCIGRITYMTAERFLKS